MGWRIDGPRGQRDVARVRRGTIHETSKKTKYANSAVYSDKKCLCVYLHIAQMGENIKGGKYVQYLGRENKQSFTSFTSFLRQSCNLQSRKGDYSHSLTLQIDILKNLADDLYEIISCSSKETVVIDGKV